MRRKVWSIYWNNLCFLIDPNITKNFISAPSRIWLRTLWSTQGLRYQCEYVYTLQLFGFIISVLEAKLHIFGQYSFYAFQQIGDQSNSLQGLLDMELSFPYQPWRIHIPQWVMPNMIHRSKSRGGKYKKCNMVSIDFIRKSWSILFGLVLILVLSNETQFN